MNNIAKDKISDYCVTGEFDIAASIKADEDSKESKAVTLRFKLDSVPLGDIIASSLKDKRINWQAGARGKFNLVPSSGIVIVDYKGGRQPIDPKANAKNYLATCSDEEFKALTGFDRPKKA